MSKLHWFGNIIVISRTDVIWELEFTDYSTFQSDFQLSSATYVQIQLMKLYVTL